MDIIIGFIVVFFGLIGIGHILMEELPKQREELKKAKDNLVYSASNIRQEVYTKKHFIWENQNKIKSECDNYRSSVAVWDFELNSDSSVYQHYLKSIEAINKEKKSEQDNIHRKKKEIKHAYRAGLPIPTYYEQKFPDEKKLKKLLDFKSQIAYVLSDWKEADSYQSCLQGLTYARYRLSSWQIELYENFGLDDNAQGIELKQLLKDKLPVVTEAYGHPLEYVIPFDWFPYNDMDKAYFEDVD